MTAQRSMTGFGRAEGSINERRCVAYIRGVNSRFLDLKIKTPTELEPFEQVIAEAIKGRLKRGRVEIKFEFDRDGVPKITPEVDMETAKAYANAFKDLKQTAEIPGEIDIALLAGMPGVINLLKPEILEDASDKVAGLVSEAVDDFIKMSRSEAEKLCSDISRRIDTVSGLLDEVEKIAPEDLKKQQEKIKNRIMELSSLPELDEKRLAEELAYWAGKADITEETVRLHTHISKFREYMDGNQPAGKKFDFLLQEMFRESNTLGAKAVSAGISHIAVEMKAELEKIREQVQNLE